MMEATATEKLSPVERAQKTLDLKVEINIQRRLEANAASGQARLEDLMSRRSASRWDPTKVARQVRRLQRARQARESAALQREQLEHSLQLLSEDEDDGAPVPAAA